MSRSVAARRGIHECDGRVQRSYQRGGGSMKSLLLLLAAVMMLVSHPVAAQSKAAQAKSIAGTWNATVTLPNGGGGAPTLTFAVKGDSVSGTVKRPSGEVVPLRGTIKGSDLTYTYTIAANGQ